MKKINHFLELENICGIYAIINIFNPTSLCEIGKPYIGQSRDIGFRLERHFRELRLKKHHNRFLQEDWIKYTEPLKNFFIFLIEECSSNKELAEREYYWIRKFKSYHRDYGYNIKYELQYYRFSLFKNPIPEDKILQWIKLFFDKYKKYPSVLDGEIDMPESDIKNFGKLTWRGLDADLKCGYRGLPKISLSSLKNKNGLYIEKYDIFEASKVAISMNIKSAREYFTRAKEDSRLPVRPSAFYNDEWIDWYDFLDLRYKNLKEASIATQNLEIKTKEEYCKRYKEDSKLVSCPCETYKNEWKCWKTFLGVKNK